MKKKFIVLVLLFLLFILILPNNKYISFLNGMIVTSNDKLGDINDDGVIDSKDYELLKTHILQKNILKKNQKKRADINSDNKVSTLDYIMIRNKLLTSTSSTEKPKESVEKPKEQAEKPKEPAEIKDITGYEEGIGITIIDTDYKKNKVYYSTDKNNWIEIDSELIRRLNDNTVRADILGLKPGKYYVKVIDSKNREKISDQIEVTSHDRSGYAHFNYTKGVGAYNDDGTLKKDAVVLYVRDTTKNSVKLNIAGTEYVGLVNILENIGKLGKPFVLRVVGKITAPQLNYIEWKYPSNSIEHINEVHDLLGYNKNKSVWSDGRLSGIEMEELGIASFSDDRNNGINQLDNLPYYVFPKTTTIDGKNYTTYDIHYNYIQITGASNVTIEGVGKNGELFQFGLRLSEANSIEVRNLKFEQFPDRALIISGKAGKTEDELKNNMAKYGNYWIHNNIFYAGKNNFDVRPSYASDSAYEKSYHPDETLGFANCHGITSSYNYFNKSYKAYLINDNESAGSYNISLHHNYYYRVMQRIPRVRNANVHSYNNYYYFPRQMGYVVDMNAFVFSENNYYYVSEENSKYAYSSPFRINWHNDSEAGYANSKVKSYGDYFNCDKTSSNLNNNYCIVRVFNDYSEVPLDSSQNSTYFTISKSRDEKTKNTVNKFDLINNYSNFDTDPNLFYYDKINKRSNVSNMLSVKDVPTFCKEHTGVLK